MSDETVFTKLSQLEKIIICNTVQSSFIKQSHKRVQNRGRRKGVHVPDFETFLAKKMKRIWIFSMEAVHFEAKLLYFIAFQCWTFAPPLSGPLPQLDPTPTPPPPFSPPNFSVHYTNCLPWSTFRHRKIAEILLELALNTHQSPILLSGPLLKLVPTFRSIQSYASGKNYESEDDHCFSHILVKIILGLWCGCWILSTCICYKYI